MLINPYFDYAGLSKCWLFRTSTHRFTREYLLELKEPPIIGIQHLYVIKQMDSFVKKTTEPKHVDM